MDPIDRSLVLLDLDGFSSAEISVATGYSTGKVIARLCRTKAILRTRLGKAGWQAA